MKHARATSGNSSLRSSIPTGGPVTPRFSPSSSAVSSLWRLRASTSTPSTGEPPFAAMYSATSSVRSQGQLGLTRSRHGGTIAHVAVPPLRRRLSPTLWPPRWRLPLRSTRRAQSVHRARVIRQPRQNRDQAHRGNPDGDPGNPGDGEAQARRNSRPREPGDRAINEKPGSLVLMPAVPANVGHGRGPAIVPLVAAHAVVTSHPDRLKRPRLGQSAFHR